MTHRITRSQQRFSEARKLAHRVPELRPDLVGATPHLVDLGTRRVHGMSVAAFAPEVIATATARGLLLATAASVRLGWKRRLRVRDATE